MTHDFLPDRDPIRWTPPEGFPKRMKPLDMFFQLAADGGHISNGLEVVTARSSRRPTAADLRSAWSKRKAGRASPVLMIVFYYERGGDRNAGGGDRNYEGGGGRNASDGDRNESGGGRYYDSGGERVSVCGPVGAQPAVHHSLDVERVERIADCALSEPNRHSAVRFLASALPEADSPFPGLRNVGLLSTQELRYGVPRRKGWRGAVERAAPLCSLRGRELVEALGFGVEMLDVNSWMLTAPYQGHEQGLSPGEGRAGGDAAGGGEATPPAGAEAPPTPSEDRLATAEKRAVAVFCRDDEQFEAPSSRFGAASPVSRALAVADREQVDWVILTRASEIRLYAARRDTGVGRKGRAESFVEANLSLLPKKQAGYLPLLFSADALSPEGTFEDILERSHDYAARLAKRLRERVYREVVPALAQAVADRMPPNPSQEALADAYEQVMVILFRLLFVAYAEDKDLLPYRSNSKFAERSLSQMARRLSDARREGRLHLDNNSTALWDNVVELWDAVNNGKEDWGVPVYNGGMFAADRSVSPAGAAIAKMRLTDAEFAPALEALLTEEGSEGLGPIDFRELSAREFGTIYEGLLESSLSLAAEDLTLDRKDTYVPAKEGDEVAVKAGEPYLHNRSGVRKETGSYFTKPFAVEHLLDHALEPALDEHLKRLDELRAVNDEAALTEAFFDFRCADIAMGSGHFLVAALDRIEAKLSAWLTLNPLAAITQELERLRRNAYKALGDLGAGVEIESSSLLRRQVARHCIYGVDLNPIAVELARLAVWVHTFVPGLPLSFLDHNLVCGDSLTGVGGLDEVVAALDPDSAGGGADAPSLFRGQVEDLLHRADHALRRLARTSDANKKEIEEARIAHRNALEAVSGAEAVCDVITAARAGVVTLPEKFDEAVFVGLSSASEVEEGIEKSKVEEAIGKFKPLHFPVKFPEVFLRDRPGFDCLLGNPPWEQVVVAEKVWWGLYLPGVRGLPVQRMNAAIRGFREERPDLEVMFQQACNDADHLRALLRITFPDLGGGHTDLYKAFCWRNWQLMSSRSAAGIVLPRAVLQTKGSEVWRKTVLKEGLFSNVITLLNTGGWVCEDIHAQKLVSLTVLKKYGDKDRDAKMRFGGPFSSRNAFDKGKELKSNSVPIAEFESWSDDASFPQIPNHPGALSLFTKMREHPRFDVRPTGRQADRPTGRQADNTKVGFYHTWRFRPVQGDFNTTNDKHRFILDSGASVQSANSMPQRTNSGSPSTGESRQ